MTGTILTLSAGYALVAAMLAWLVIAGRAHLVVKAAVTFATAGLIYGTYVAVGDIRGLPSDAPPPPSFKLHWARVVEPNPLVGEPGHVFLWLEELDAENYPSGLPRAHKLAYDAELVRKVEIAMGQIQSGEEIAGVVSEEPAGDTAEETAEEVVEAATRTGPGAEQVGDRGYRFDPSDLSFGAAPRPVLPEKPSE